MSKLVPTIPIAILIALIFILRFSRTQPVGHGKSSNAFWVLLELKRRLWWLYESDTVFNAVKILPLALPYSLPFMIDRPIHEKFKENGISSGLVTLTFPVRFNRRTFPVFTGRLFRGDGPIG